MIEESNKERAGTGFWQRQLLPGRTPGVVMFDVAFGIILPLVCLVADPIVFKTCDSFGPALLERYRLLGYSEVLIGIAGLAISLRRNRTGACLAGTLFAGALFSFGLGCILIPFSLMGILIAGIGLLGFIPFFTSYVLFRSGVRALALEKSASRKSPGIAIALATAFLVLAAPAATQLRLNRFVRGQMQTILTAGAPEAHAAGQRLRRIRFIADLNSFVQEYAKLTDTNRQSLVAETYRLVTGKDIEEELARIDD
jgi:hypothetical protein